MAYIFMPTTVVGAMETVWNYFLIYSLCRENKGYSMFIIWCGSIIHTIIAYFALNQQIELS